MRYQPKPLDQTCRRLKTKPRSSADRFITCVNSPNSRRDEIRRGNNLASVNQFAAGDADFPYNQTGLDGQIALTREVAQ